MLTTRFGIEIEFTGITRNQAAKIAAEHLHGTVDHTGGGYDTYTVTAADGRAWKIMRDASIRCEKRVSGHIERVSDLHSVELVSPILTYREDIETLQELVRKLRHAKAFANNSCGIHIHLDGANHTVRSIRNFINIIASKNDLFYSALQIAPERARYCKKMDERLVEKINRKKPKTMQAIEDIWYEGYSVFEKAAWRAAQPTTTQAATTSSTCTAFSRATTRSSFEGSTASFTQAKLEATLFLPWHSTTKP